MKDRLRRLAPILAVLLIAAAARLGPWHQIFTAQGVRLAADGDTYYHALRAERMTQSWPHVPWFDPGMNHPYGAEIPWPPLLDALIATVARVTGAVTPDHVAGVAAIVPPIAGLALVAVTALLARTLLGGGLWWDAALLVALLPATVRQSFVGRPDHHVFEVLLSALLYLVYISGVREAKPGWLRPAVLGSLVTLAYWNWSGSTLYLFILACHFAVLHLTAQSGDSAPERSGALLSRGLLLASLLLTLTVGLWGPPGALRSPKLTPITGLAPATCLLTAVSVALVAAVRRRVPKAGFLLRAGLLGLPVLIAGVLLLSLSSQLRSGVVHGLTALGASSPWYESIAEFWPLLFSGRQPWTLEIAFAAIAFGLTPLAVPLAARQVARAWTEEPARRPELCFFVLWCVVTLGLALLRRRFEGYAAVPLGMCGALAGRGLAEAVASRFSGFPWAGRLAMGSLFLAAIAPGLPVIALGAVAEMPAGAADKHPLLQWLRGVPSTVGREGVMAAWSHGHEIQWFARKSAVSTPFGTDIDKRSVEDEAAFFLTEDSNVGRELLQRRRIGFLLLENPVREVATMQRFAPGTPVYAIEERSWSAGSRYAFHPQFFRLLGSRLFFFDGVSLPDGGPGLGEYRLLSESSTTVDVLGKRAQQFKLFGVVAGALLHVEGARPGALVIAEVPVETDVGRRFRWTTQAVSDAEGEALLRVPYASGPNGLVLAGRYRVFDESRAQSIGVGDSQVTLGETIRVGLGQ